jgi:hypothetical protein
VELLLGRIEERLTSQIKSLDRIETQLGTIGADKSK